MAPDPAGALAALAGADPGRDPAADAARLGLAGRVLACIPDLTRPVDPRPALAALAARCEQLDVMVGLGLHRPMTADELAPLSPWRPMQSDPDDVVDTGELWLDLAAGRHRVPGQLDRRVAQARTVVTIGICELHQYAGVSGGHKGVVVGCGGRATIAALHHRDVVTDPTVRLGVVAGNPFRQAVDALGRRQGAVLALNQLPGGAWMAGDPADVVAHAAAALDPWWTVAAPSPGALLRVPPAKASSLYQASRAATYLALSPRPPLLPGATLRLDAACPEGLGAEAGFVAALASCPPPWTALLTGPPPTGPGAQRAVMFALLARDYQLEVIGCHDPAALRAVGIAATADRPALPAGWLEVTTPFSRLPQLAG